jgi:plasmid stabilization system protein ParE
MAEVIWNKQAEHEWRQKLLYGLSEFGQTTAIKFVQRTNYVIGIIRKHPKIGTPEAFLQGRKKVYRQFHLLGPLKIVYYYIESSDTIRIVDVWDTRREPSKLIKRIRRR